MRRQTWPNVPDDEGITGAYWDLNGGGHDFWSYVDSQESYAPYTYCPCGDEPDPTCPNWAHVRDGAWCFAARSDRGRCAQAVVPGTPFCDFHLSRAWDALCAAADKASRDRLRRRAEFEESLVMERLHHLGVVAEDIEIAAARLPERVYFFRAGHAVKIGRSVNPEKRVRTLGGTKAPADVDLVSGELLGTIAGGSRVEGDLHRRFRAHRLVGEWFTYGPLADTITALLTPVEQAAS